VADIQVNHVLARWTSARASESAAPELQESAPETFASAFEQTEQSVGMPRRKDVMAATALHHRL
jgi:hypothetical protein